MDNLDNTDLWEEFNKSLKRFINKYVDNVHDAEEILQDVLVRFMNGLTL